MYEFLILALIELLFSLLQIVSAFHGRAQACYNEKFRVLPTNATKCRHHAHSDEALDIFLARPDFRSHFTP